MINTDYIQQYNEETKDVFTIENLIYIRNRYYRIWWNLKNKTSRRFWGYWRARRNSYWTYEKINDLFATTIKRYWDDFLAWQNHY